MASYKVFCVSALLILVIQECHSQIEVCGIPPLNTKIVGGQAASAGSWPWQASVTSNKGLCGGSLINNQWVLTAAHCCTSDVTLSSVTVKLGFQKLSEANSNTKTLKVLQVIQHPSYNSKSQDNDICLLQLNSKVTFTDYIQPVCLAAPGSSFYSGTTSWVTGWGTTSSGGSTSDTLQEVQIPIVGNRQCNCNYGVGSITDNMICAGLSAGGKDSCQGDSGGPIVSKQAGRWIQSGVVSFGNGCARPNFPGVYARVSQYQSWINSLITSNQPGYITYTSSGTDSDLSITCSGLPPATTTVPTTTTPKPVFCGQASLNTRLSGSNSTSGIWPWMVSLQKNGSHVCGGTLVAVDYVLSSANCFINATNSSDWTAVLGRLKQNGINSNQVSLNVTSITLSSLTGDNVALLRLAAKPTLSDFIQPICLGSGQTFAVGTTCWAAGWSSGRGGVEGIMQEFQTVVRDCGNTSSSSSICTDVIALEQGDVGGPLMCKQGSAWFQAAVLTLPTNSSATNKIRADLTLSSFTSLKAYDAFLRLTLGSFLSSPAAANAPFVFVHLLVFIMSLYVFV